MMTIAFLLPALLIGLAKYCQGQETIEIPWSIQNYVPRTYEVGTTVHFKYSFGHNVIKSPTYDCNNMFSSEAEFISNNRYTGSEPETVYFVCGVGRHCEQGQKIQITFVQSEGTTPTSSPSASPTSSPTASPTSSPTASPTVSPSHVDEEFSASPTASPTVSPTESPTVKEKKFVMYRDSTFDIKGKKFKKRGGALRCAKFCKQKNWCKAFRSIGRKCFLLRKIPTFVIESEGDKVGLLEELKPPKKFTTPVENAVCNIDDMNPSNGQSGVTFTQCRNKCRRNWKCRAFQFYMNTPGEDSICTILTETPNPVELNSMYDCVVAVRSKN